MSSSQVVKIERLVKPMGKRSTAWKDLEKYVAKLLRGKRNTRGADFSKSLPDVEASGSYINGLDDNILILAECKHSKNQPFIDLLKSTLSQYKIVKIGEYIFWDLSSTAMIMLYLSQRHEIKSIQKKIPGYIKENYKQASSYSFPADKIPLPIVVIAKKNQPLRVAYTKLKEFEIYELPEQSCPNPKLYQSKVK